MRHLGRVLLYLVCLPTDLPCWIALAAARWIWGSRFVTRDGVLGLELRDGSFPHRLIKWWWVGCGCVTIAPHAMVFTAGNAEDDELWTHELVHTDQTEAASLLGAALAGAAAVAGARWWMLVLLLLMPLISYYAAVLAAVLRGRAWYWDNVNERAAYAIAAVAALAAGLAAAMAVRRRAREQEPGPSSDDEMMRVSQAADRKRAIAAVAALEPPQRGGSR